MHSRMEASLAAERGCQDMCQSSVESAVSAWRWLRERAETVWYPTMRLFRQRRLGEWDDPFALG
jgi:hypothetical protein